MQKLYEKGVKEFQGGVMCMQKLYKELTCKGVRGGVMQKLYKERVKEF